MRCTSPYRRRCSRGSLARRGRSIIGDWDWYWRRVRVSVDLGFLVGNGLELVGEQVIVGSAPELVVHVCCLLFLGRRIGSRGKQPGQDGQATLTSARGNILARNKRTQWMWWWCELPRIERNASLMAQEQSLRR